MGSYFGEFSKALQGDLRADSAALKMISPAWDYPQRAGSSSEANYRPVLKHSSLQELVGTGFFSGGDIAAADVGGVAAAVAHARSQISSTRDGGVKKRRNQTKKVVSIPAPEGARGKPGGDAVPSDSWSWRKYGQKPIKGSPFPRGYYRCSSSKGCSARKQVERSKTEPNMIIVTYTCEHNHPLPAQKSGSPAAKAASPAAVAATAAPMAKMDLPEAREVPHRSFPSAPPELSWTEDFFADLGELEEDAMKLVFSKDLVEGKMMGEAEDEDALDVFRRFDWVKHSGESK